MTHWISPALAVVLVFILVYRLASAPPRQTQRARPVRAPAKPAPAPRPVEPVAAALPKLSVEEDSELEPTYVGARTKSLTPPTTRIVYDEDAARDEPTQPRPLIRVTAVAHSDKGVRRRRNEDSFLVLDREGIYAVADGMGGYRGGEIASKLAVTTIEKAFVSSTFDGPPHASIPRRASELARAVQMANNAILDRANGDKMLEGMGTTICAASFSRNKQRLYIAHVGDSRAYCYRGGKLNCMTSDHTMADLGVIGDAAAHLSRAVGVWPTVPIDIILGKPLPGDLYVLCSDGLTKMVADSDIERIVASTEPPAAVEELIRIANENGGKDNISVVIVRVEDPTTTAAIA